MWVVFTREALLSLKDYDIETKKWKCINNSAIWIIVNFLLNNQINGQEVVNIYINLEKKTFKILINRYLNKRLMFI